MTALIDWIIIGAGPAGLAGAIEAKKRGQSCWVLEKGCLVNSIRHFPTDMNFFTTADLLEIGDLPLITASEKPNRMEVLKYYRRVVEHYQLAIRSEETVFAVEGRLGQFSVRTRDRFQEERSYEARRIIVATGYYDNPNYLGIPGEDLSKVSHYYTECHPFFRKKVAVVGGKNSAAESCLDLYRNGGAEVTLIHRGPAMGRDVKYWVLPDINNRIERGEITAYFSSRLVEVRDREIVISTPDGDRNLANDFVFALTGYHPDVELLRSMGIEVESETCIPTHDPETLESNVAGIHLAGSVASGKMTNRIFIETGRFHGPQIFRSLYPGQPPQERGMAGS